MTNEPLHSNVVGSSSAARRLACPGSIDLEAEMPSIETSYAAEGTACHSAVEYLLNEDKLPADLEGMTFYDHEMTPERIDWIDRCLVEFEQVVGDREFDTELRLSFPGIEGAFGTGDVLYWSDDRSLVGVMDWKFGQGVPVPAKGNKQMMFLLCSARAYLGEACAGAKMLGTIVQPRRDYAETVEFSHAELDAFEADLRHAVNHGRYGSDPLSTGPHCKFCNAIGICPKQRTRLEEVASLRDAKDKVLLVLNAKDDLLRLIKEAEKIAFEALQQGLDVPGYKLVRKIGNRAWTDPKNAERWLGRHGLKAAERRKTVLKSPNQIEGLRPDLKEGLKRYWDKPDGGLALAPADDRREAVLTGEGLDKALTEALASYVKGE